MPKAVMLAFAALVLAEQTPREMEMRQQQLRRLPASIRQLVDLVERETSRQISIEIGPLEGPRGQFDNLAISATEAKVILRDAEGPIQGLIHEILHIKRMWLERAPFLEADLSRLYELQSAYQQALRDLDGNCGLLDETLEHTFWILPEEKRLGVYDADHWRRINRAILAESANLRFPNRQREFGLRVWLDVQFLGDAQLVREWEDRLRTWGLLAAARNYERAVSAAYPDKLEMLGISIEHMKLEPDFLQLVWFDAKEGQRRVTKF